MSTPTIPGKSPANPIVIPDAPPPVVAPAPPLALAVTQLNASHVPEDPRSTKRSFDQMEAGAVEASSQPQVKRVRVDAAPANAAAPALFEAIARGDVDQVRDLLARHPEWRGAYDSSPAGATPLCVAAGLGNEQIISLLLLGEPVDRPARNGATPVMFAAHGGHVRIINSLCLLGADLQKCSSTFKENSLVYAIKSKKLEACKFLMSKGLELQQVSQTTDPHSSQKVVNSPLLTALATDFCDFISWLQEEGKLQPDSVEPASQVPLIHAAARFGAAATVRRLLECGADPRSLARFPGGEQVFTGCLATADKFCHFNVIETALRFRKERGISDTVWPLIEFTQFAARDLARHADLWISPSSCSDHGLSVEPVERNPARLLQLMAINQCMTEDPAAWNHLEQEGFSAFFRRSNWHALSHFAVAPVLGKNAFPKFGESMKATAAQQLHMLVEWMSWRCGQHAPFSGLHLTPQTEQVMNRMFDLQRNMMVSAIAHLRKKFDEHFKRLPWL